MIQVRGEKREDNDTCDVEREKRGSVGLNPRLSCAIGKECRILKNDGVKVHRW